MANFWDSVNKGVNALVSNVDKIAIGFSGILQQRANIGLAKAKANAQLAALQAQAADANAQAAIANATSKTAASNPTATGVLSQLTKSPIALFALGFAIVGGLYLMKQGKA